jgi:hypothetical protein
MWKFCSPDLEVLVPGCAELFPEMVPEEFGTFVIKIKAYGWFH